jgi:hypothetical protein
VAGVGTTAESITPAVAPEGRTRQAAPSFSLAPALLLLTPLLLGVAVWNGFPLVFYDTGAYIAQGLAGAFFVERSPIYSLLLPATGAFISLWLTAAAQALMTAYLICELARAVAPRLSLSRLLGICLALMLITGIGWYVGQIEPDCFTPLVVLGSYLMLFHAGGLPRARLIATIIVTGLAVAAHPSHLGLIGGLLLCAGALWTARRRMRELPQPKLWPACSALGLSIVLLLAANYGFTRDIFVSRAGSVFVLARLMQDGIVQRLMAESCRPPGEIQPYTLCAYRTRMPRNANAWLWGEHSPFRVIGGFKRSDGEYGRIVRDSLVRYPLMHLRAAIVESLRQFAQFQTGDGIESQQAILERAFRETLPAQLPAYLAARQQTEVIRFRAINLIHVPVGVLSLLGLLILLRHAARRGRWREAALPATVLLALMGNAIICGTFSNPHDRYQSRLIWVPVLVLLLARARDPKALQPLPER